MDIGLGITTIVGFALCQKTPLLVMSKKRTGVIGE
jgi:hypothetical protein